MKIQYLNIEYLKVNIQRLFSSTQEIYSLSPCEFEDILGIFLLLLSHPKELK